MKLDNTTRDRRAKQLRKLLLEENRRIVDSVKAENRDFTPDEDKEYEANMRAVAEHDKARKTRRVDKGKERAPDGIDRQTCPASAVGSSNSGGLVSGLDDDDESPIISNRRSVVPYLRHKGLLDNAAEYRGLTFGGFIRSMVDGPQSAVERRALAEGTDSAGGFTVPTVLMGRLIDRLRAKSTIFRAGAQTVPLTTNETNLARLATDPVATWKTENLAVGESDPTFENVQFVPRVLAVIVRCSRELLDDSVNLEPALTNAFAQAMSLEIERVAFVGTGTPPEPTGLKNTTNVTEIPLDAVLTSYAPLISAWETLATGNANEPTAAIMHPAVAADFAALTDTTDQPLRRPELLENLPFLSTTSVPSEVTAGSDIYVGDYTQLFVGIRTDVRVEVLKERYADFLQYGFLAWLRADVQVAHPESFAIVTGVDT